MNRVEQLEQRLRLLHIEEAAPVIDFVRDRTRDDYANDKLLRSAVERKLITVGEALNRAIKAEPSVANSITGADKIIGFRNVLIHNYPDLNDDRVWRIIETHLPSSSPKYALCLPLARTLHKLA